jgi:hypothetical protein
MDTLRPKKAQVGGILTVVIGVIVIVAAAIPVTNSVIASANLTGTTKTLVDLIPIFLALAGMAYAAFASGLGRK